MHQRGAVAFMARSVARHHAALGTLAVLDLAVPIELPPVGLITLRGQPPAPTTGLLLECLRAVAATLRAGD